MADVFGDFIMPEKLHYPSDPTPFVENKLPLEDLRELFGTLPDIEPLTKSQQRALGRLRRLLAGEFVNGVPIGDLDDAEN